MTTDPKSGRAADGIPRAWAELLRLPDLFSIPGDPAAGFLLTSGVWIPGAGTNLAFLCTAALFARISGTLAGALAALKNDCKNHPDRPLPSGKVSIRAAAVACALSASLSLLFSAIGVLPFLADILLIFCIFRAAVEQGRPDPDRRSKCCFFSASCRFLNLALGAAGAFTLLQKTGKDVPLERFLITGIFSCGVFFYIYGLSKIVNIKSTRLSKRSGRILILAGAAVSYGTLFGIMILKNTRDWHTLLCGFVSASSAGIFLVLAFWFFRLYRNPLFPFLVYRSVRLLRFALIFLQAAAVSAAGILSGALALIAAGCFSRFLEPHPEKKMTEKLTELCLDGSGRNLNSESTISAGISRTETIRRKKG